MSSNEEYLDSLLKAAMESDELNLTGEVEAFWGDEPIAIEEPVEEEQVEKEPVIDETMMDEPVIDETVMDDLVADESVLDEEQPEADLSFEMSDDPNKALSADEIAAMFDMMGGSEEEAVEEPVEDELSMDEFAIDDAGMDFGVDEAELAELAGLTGDDGDVEDLLESMAMEDEELAEINDLLKKSDESGFMEDDMLAMLEKASAENETEHFENDEFGFFHEDESENKGEEAENVKKSETKEESSKADKKKKKRRGLFGKSKKEKAAEDTGEAAQTDDTNESAVGSGNDEMADLFSQFASDGMESFDDLAGQLGGEELFVNGDEIPEKKAGHKKENKEKKQGFFGKLFDLLTEEIEEEEEVAEKPKKEKKAKKKKKSENEEIISEMEEEDAAAEEEKKKKKKKKPKKIKEEEPVSEEDMKKLPKKMVIRIFVLCFSLLALIVLVDNGLLAFSARQTARKAYYNKDYQATYENLIGRKLNESDALMLEKATIVLKLQRKYDSYINYMNMGNKEYALNALLNGYKLYVETAGEAANQNMTEDFELVKRLITDALADTYGVSEQKAAELIAIEDAGAYKAALAEIFEGDDWAADTDVSVQPETEEPLEDVLTEEQEMIDQMAE